MGKITTVVITVGEGEPQVLSILRDGRATRCGTSPDLCGQFRKETQQIASADGKIVPDQTKVGLCGLTGVACLQMARTIANELP